MKKIMSAFLIVALVVLLCGCVTTTSSDTITDVDGTTFPLISYEEAFNFVKNCEQKIIDANENVGPNKLGESAAEFIIFSDEYAGLYCAYWAALEVVGEPNDSRFEKSKLRWQMDFTNEEWKGLLLDAFYQGGAEALRDEYGRIYGDIVHPTVEEDWKRSLETIHWRD